MTMGEKVGPAILRDESSVDLGEGYLDTRSVRLPTVAIRSGAVSLRCLTTPTTLPSAPFSAPTRPRTSCRSPHILLCSPPRSVFPLFPPFPPAPLPRSSPHLPLPQRNVTPDTFRN
jgi:hypothetical protein